MGLNNTSLGQCLCILTEVLLTQLSFQPVQQGSVFAISLGRPIFVLSADPVPLQTDLINSLIECSDWKVSWKVSVQSMWL